MNICLDARTATPHFPGIGRYVSSLIRYLPDLLPEQSRLEILYDPAYTPDTGENTRLRLIPARVSPFSIRQQSRLPGEIKRLGADIYHSPYYLMPYRVHVPTVLTVYDLIPLHYPENVSAQARLLFRLSTTLAVRSARQIIAISEATRQDYRKTFHLSEDKITRIPLAASPHFRPQPQPEIERAKAKYAIPANYVLYVGINKPHKNLARLVQAWEQVQRQGGSQTPMLVIAGAWDDRYPQAKQVLQALGLQEQVRFMGPVEEEDLPALYSGAKLFVFPSIYEGFGLPVLEAMQCGTPVACSNTSSLPEIAGEAAETFDPHQTLSLVETLSGLIDNGPRLLELSQRGIIQAARFSWEKTASATLEVYQHLL